MVLGIFSQSLHALRGIICDWHHILIAARLTKKETLVLEYERFSSVFITFRNGQVFKGAELEHHTRMEEAVHTI